MSNARRSGRRWVLAAILGTAIPAAAHATPAAGLFYERTVMREADGRCHLFEPQIGAALAASSLQARGAALRAGARDSTLLAMAERARLAAYGVACTSPDLATAAERVKKGFSGYARMTGMSFPGDLARWEADRSPRAPVVDHKAVPGPLWRLSEAGVWQGIGAASPTLGIAADAERPMVVVNSAEVAEAYTALLVMRDPAKAPDPYLDPRRNDLNGRLPPRSVTRAFVAQSRDSAPASLLPKGGGQGVQFAFPAAAAKALEGLDPREAVTVEFVYPGKPTERAVFEVGDFAAARAFLAAR